MAHAEPKRIGILLTRGPGSLESRRALQIASAAVRLGHRVEIFLMDEGADLLRSPEVGLGLAGPETRVAVCTQTAVNRDLPLDLPGIDYASQFQLARSVAGCDRFLSLP